MIPKSCFHDEFGVFRCRFSHGGWFGYNHPMDKDGRKQSEHEKDELRHEVNLRISRCCNYAALIIILVSIASFVLGRFDTFFVQLAIMVSIALLAIAAINAPRHKP